MLELYFIKHSIAEQRGNPCRLPGEDIILRLCGRKALLSAVITQYVKSHKARVNASPFWVLVSRHPRQLSFNVKRQLCWYELDQIRNNNNSFEITVDRADVFTTSVRELLAAGEQQLTGELIITFN